MSDLEYDVLRVESTLAITGNLIRERQTGYTNDATENHYMVHKYVGGDIGVWPDGNAIQGMIENSISVFGPSPFVRGVTDPDSTSDTGYITPIYPDDDVILGATGLAGLSGGGQRLIVLQSDSAVSASDIPSLSPLSIGKDGMSYISMFAPGEGNYVQGLTFRGSRLALENGLIYTNTSDSSDSFKIRVGDNDVAHFTEAGRSGIGMMASDTSGETLSVSNMIKLVGANNNVKQFFDDDGRLIFDSSDGSTDNVYFSRGSNVTGAAFTESTGSKRLYIYDPGTTAPSGASVFCVGRAVSHGLVAMDGTTNEKWLAIVTYASGASKNGVTHFYSVNDNGSTNKSAFSIRHNTGNVMFGSTDAAGEKLESSASIKAANDIIYGGKISRAQQSVVVDADPKDVTLTADSVVVTNTFTPGAVLRIANDFTSNRCITVYHNFDDVTQLKNASNVLIGYLQPYSTYHLFSRSGPGDWVLTDAIKAPTRLWYDPSTAQGKTVYLDTSGDSSTTVTESVDVSGVERVVWSTKHASNLTLELTLTDAQNGQIVIVRSATGGGGENIEPIIEVQGQPFDGGTDSYPKNIQPGTFKFVEWSGAYWYVG